MLRALSEALRPQALLEFELPLAPQRIEELPAPQPGGEALLVYAHAAQALLLVATEGVLTLAFEATLFELLQGARYPAARPRRARGGSLLAQLQGPSGPAVATCYAWPAGERVQAQDATTPQHLEVGRLLARLHLLGEAHPASIADPLEAPLLASRLPSGEAGEALRDVLQAGLPPLPSGATHGCLSPAHVLFVGERASAVVPGGTSASAPLLLDLAQAICGWALGLAAPLPAVRALLSGYQALRRLSLEERELLPQALRCAAARAGALQLLRGDAAHPLDALRACDALDARDLRAAAG